MVLIRYIQRSNSPNNATSNSQIKNNIADNNVLFTIHPKLHTHGQLFNDYLVEDEQNEQNKQNEQQIILPFNFNTQDVKEDYIDYYLDEPNLNQNADSFNLVSKEREFLALQNKINSQKEFLEKNASKIKSIENQNQYLKTVRDDYKKYNNFIVQNKNDQIKAFTMLDNYLNDLTTNGSLSENKLKSAQNEQNEILQMIQNIKSNLNEITK